MNKPLVTLSLLFCAPWLTAQVVLNEVMGANETTVVPGALAEEFPDWIELHNLGGSAVNLSGWGLSDDLDKPEKWLFPSGTTIPAGGYLLILGGNDGETDASGNLRFNFGIDQNGSVITLADQDEMVVSTLTAGRFGDDEGYGRHPTSGSEVYFPVATPGAANNADGKPRNLPVTFSLPRGYYSSAQTVTLTAVEDDAVIYYTTDGSEPINPDGSPGESAWAYSDPISIPQTTILRAASVSAGFFPSPSRTHSYFLFDLDGAAADGTSVTGFNASFLTQTQPAGYADLSSGDYDMDPRITMDTDQSSGHGGLSVAQAMLQGLRDIPTISVALPMESFAGPTGIYTNSESEGIAWERACSAEFIPASGDSKEGFQENCGLRVQGGASRRPDASPKHSLSFRFRRQYGNGRLRYPLFPESKVKVFNSIALRAFYNNSWIHSIREQRIRASMIRDQWMRDTMREMGHPDAGHGIFAHLFINGLYWGVHNVHERQDNAHYAEYNGGDEDLLDARNGAKFVNGDQQAFLAMRQTVINGTWEEVQEAINLENYVDFQLLQQFGANLDLKVDGNWRAVGGGPNEAPWRLYSWDGERVLEEVRDSTVPLDPYNVRNSLENRTEYRDYVKERVHQHFLPGGALSSERCEARWMQHANLLDRAVIAESARWGDYRDASRPRDRGDWLAEQNRLITSYFPTRSARVQLRLRPRDLISTVPAPEFLTGIGTMSNLYLPPGETLDVAPLPNGSLYYTTDGSDPRSPGGILATSDSIPLPASATVRARYQENGEWSALTIANVTREPFASATTVAISEINYHPREITVQSQATLPTDFSNRDLFEYIEVTNTGSTTVNLAGTRFTEGIEFEFPPTILPPGGQAIVAKNLEAFEARYGNTIPVAGIFMGNLSNGGERVTLVDPNGEIIETLRYRDDNGWPGRADGNASSLQRRDLFLDAGDSEAWMSSVSYHGSPGVDGALEGPGLVINEVASNSGIDVVEFHNITASSIDIESWFLSDDNDVYNSATLPALNIPGMGYASVNESVFRPSGGSPITNYEGNLGQSPVTVTSPSHGLATGDIVTINDYDGFAPYDETWEVTVLDANRFTIPTRFLENHPTKGICQRGRPFGLSSIRGEDLWLIETDDAGNPLNFVDRVEFSAARLNQSLGRWPDGGGVDLLVPMTTTTLNSENLAPVLGPIRLSEVHYFSADPNREFVELSNTGSSTVSLDRWRLRGGADFDFTADHVIAPDQKIVIVFFDPTDSAAASAFRSAYGIDASTLLLGPATDGPLGDTDGTVRLEEGLTDPRAKVFVDEVRYSSHFPWPSPAGERSLQRLNGANFGRFVSSWITAVPTPGSILPPGQSFTSWATENGVSGPTDDPDGDGLSNLEEFALGLDPNSFSQPLAIDSSAISFTVDTLSAGVRVRFFSSPDLLSWTPRTAIPSGLPIDGIETREFAFFPAQDPALFFRIEVTED